MGDRARFMALCRAVAALVACAALYGVTGTAATELGDVPYHPPQLPTLIPDTFEDSYDKPPQFLVDAMRRNRGDADNLGEGGKAHPAADQSKIPVEINKYMNATKRIPYTDKDEVDAPKPVRVKKANGIIYKIGCGKKKGQIPCKDSSTKPRVLKRMYGTNLPQKINGKRLDKEHPWGPNVMPNGKPNQIMPSWDQNPSATIDSTPYGRPHEQFFQAEPGCQTDPLFKSYDQFNVQVDAELKRAQYARKKEREHLCVGLLNLLKAQYSELRAKGQTRRRTMSRKNALPFTQLEKRKNMGPHRRLLAAETRTDVLSMNATSLTNKFNKDGTLKKFKKGTNILTGQKLPKWKVTNTPDYTMPKKDLSRFDKSLKQIKQCVRDLKELLPALNTLRADVTRAKDPIFDEETQAQQNIGHDPEVEPADDGRPVPKNELGAGAPDMKPELWTP